MEKKIEDIRIHMDETLKIRLMGLAADDDRALGDYCRRVLAAHVELYDKGVRLVISPQRSGEGGDGSREE